MRILRRIHILFLATILLAGCAKYNVFENSEKNQKSTKVTSELVDVYLKEYKGITDTKTCGLTIEPILNGQDTVMFLVNYPEGGWEVLSADIRAPKVLVMCEGGSMTIDELVSNPAEEDLYYSLFDCISALRADETLQVTDMSATWNDMYITAEVSSVNDQESWVLIGTDVVLSTIMSRQGHLMTTEWGQGTIYTASPTWNISAPYTDSSKNYHCYTGCVPTAAAQILYYMNNKIGTPYKSYTSCDVNTYIRPNTSSVSISPSEITMNGLNPYVWDAMPLAASTSVTAAQYKYVSALMVQLGYLYPATYRLTGTGAATLNTPNVFSANFDLTCNGTSTYRQTTIGSQVVTSKLPVMLSISYYVDGNRSGHCVVADGYMSKRNTIEKTYVWNSLTQGPQYKTETSYEYEYYIAINWGWDGAGMYSGTEPIWYNAEVINWTVNSHTFTSVDGMVYGFAKK